MPVTGLRIRFALAGKFALFTVRVGTRKWYIARKYRISLTSDITIGPGPWRGGEEVVQICLGCRHGTGRKDVMNPAAASLRPDQDSMRLADCAHGAVTQLTGHIITTN